MKRTPILLLLALCTMSSCTFTGDKIDRNEEYLRAAALYNDKDRLKKCAAAFDQLRKKLREGMTSTAASQALGDAAWIERSHTNEITMLAGWIPVDIVHERAFVMHLYPNADKWSNYVVYFSLSYPDGDRSAFTIEDFLRGKVKNDDVKVHQFALCHPGKAISDIGRIEVFPEKNS